MFFSNAVVASLFLLFLLTHPLPTYQTPELCDWPLRTASSSCPSNNTALSDGRTVSSNSQCRVACSSFAKPAINVTQTAVSCNYCTRAYADNTFPNYAICIPRGVCIKKCGPERPGCIYSGTCRSQTCFHGSASGNPARLNRVTYAGGGSFVTVNNTVPGAAEEVVSTSDAHDPVASDIFSKGSDRCVLDGKASVFLPIATSVCEAGAAFGDGRDRPEGKGQCRALCRKFSDTRFEVVRVYTHCTYCHGVQENRFVDIPNKICIPRAKCVEKCGPERPGCIYTRTCRSQIYLSGIDSRKAATMSAGDHGGNITVSVDNTREATTVDPPEFGRRPESVDWDNKNGCSQSPDASQSPSATAKQSPSPSAHIGSSKSPTPSAEPDVGSTSPNPMPSGGGPAGNGSDFQERPKGNVDDKWKWLGPVLGLIGALVLAAAAIVAAYVERRPRIARRGEAMLPSLELEG